MIKMTAQSPEVYTTDEPIVNLGREEIEFLTQRVRESSRKRTRLCAHKSGEDKLHEMFVVYLNETYIRPNKHLGKDESLHILEGKADFVFMDEQGKIIDVVPLGDKATGRQFYCRIPESVYHTFLMRSPRIIIHETIEGPFRRESTVFSPWSPEEGKTEEIAKFMGGLEKSAAEFLAGRGARAS